ncbi:MAG: hypothetical protein LBD98_01495 [Endomicrobium sp.]|jgi:hypothetical protein|nr:hypothetical protein [Endomicrobium sp.]
MNEERQQHLEFIHNTIARMNENSFKIKELAVLLATVVLTIYATDKSAKVLLVSIFPTIILWILDTYYLQQERKFRGVYDDVAGLKNINDVKTYEMPIQEYTSKKDKKLCLFRILFSKTILWFYALIILVPAIFYLITK